jgi:photosystem II stability/assembly factor-like uncharacterized protein
LSIAKDHSIWASGSSGTILKSTDEGKHWDVYHIPGTDSIDFRDIEAFDALHAITVSAGSPALIYETTDGGENWLLRYENHDPKIFLDGMDFSDKKHGLIFGDPINGKLTLLKTKDGGKHWEAIDPQAIPNALTIEAGFAASGTSLVSIGNESWIGLGGEQSRIFYSNDKGDHWTASASPMLSGTAMQGIYSMSFKNNKEGIAVGGEWNAEPKISHMYTSDGGKNWHIAQGVQAYRSGSCYIKDNIYLATGISGTDISWDGGQNWQQINDEHWYSIAASPDGKLIAASGKKGKLSILQLEDYIVEGQK